MNAPPKRRPTFYLPPNANIPKEWIKHADLDIVVVPSWSRSGFDSTHEITIRMRDRKMFCDDFCPGFLHRGECHHVRGLIWFTSKPMRRRARTTSGGVADTSRMAFHSMGEQERSMCRRRVYETLRALGPMTNRQIARVLGWEINRVTGRTNELVNEFGMAAQCGYASDPQTGHPGKLWMALESFNPESFERDKGATA